MRQAGVGLASGRKSEPRVPQRETTCRVCGSAVALLRYQSFNGLAVPVLGFVSVLSPIE